MALRLQAQNELNVKLSTKYIFSFGGMFTTFKKHRRFYRHQDSCPKTWSTSDMKLIKIFSSSNTKKCHRSNIFIFTACFPTTVERGNNRGKEKPYEEISNFSNDKAQVRLKYWRKLRIMGWDPVVRDKREETSDEKWGTQKEK